MSVATRTAGQSTRELHTLLVRTRRQEIRHGGAAIPGWALAVALGFGALSALGTIALGVLGPARSGATTTLLAFAFALWSGGRLAQAAVGESQGVLAPEVFRLLPIPRRRLSGALLLAGLQDPALLLCTVAFGALLAYALGQGVAAVLVALVGIALLAIALGLATTVAGGAWSRGSRGGRDAATLLITLAIAALGTASATFPLVIAAVAHGHAAVLTAIVEILPTGWPTDAVDATINGEVWRAVAPIAGLVALIAAIVAVWPGVLSRRMDDRNTRAVHAHVGRRRLPTGPAWAVAAKEVRLWTRHQIRVVCALVSVFFGIWPGVLSAINGGGELLPFVGAATLLLAAACSVNLYGGDGPWLWPTALVPDAARADVRGRQLGWLLVFGPYAAVMTVALTSVAGQAWAWPWALAFTATLLGCGAGLCVLGSLIAPLPLAEDGGPTPAWSIKIHLALPVAALSLLPGAALLTVGAIQDSVALTWAAVPLGVVIGLGLAYGLGRMAIHRVRGHEPDLIARLDPQIGIDDPGR
jgi:ABC-2 type transport system permease protein